jgi:spore germination cell wall hydrolase CwlJ-like protein
MTKYSFLSMTDVVKQMNKQYPNQFEMIAKAEIELIQESMGL